MMTAVQIGISNALICPEVPIQMAALLLSALFCSKETAAAGAALIGSAIINGVNQLWSEDLKRRGRNGDMSC